MSEHRIKRPLGDDMAAWLDYADALEARVTALAQREGARVSRIAQLEDWLFSIQRALASQPNHQRPIDWTWTCSCDVCHPVRLFMDSLASPSTPSPGEPT